MFIETENAKRTLNFCNSIIKKNQWGMIYGDAGIGKTSIKNELFKRLKEDKTQVVKLNSLYSTPMSIGVIISSLLTELLPGEKIPRDINVRQAVLQNALARKISENKRVTVVVEEAQNLHPNVIRDLKILHEMQTMGQENLFSILFFGKPSVRFDMLVAHREIRDRISMRQMTLPLDEEVVLIAEECFKLKFDSADIKAKFVDVTKKFPVTIKAVANTLWRLDGFDGVVTVENLKAADVASLKSELKELKITNRELAKEFDVSVGKLNEVINGNREDASLKDAILGYVRKVKEKAA